jgi:hypothetical protein
MVMPVRVQETPNPNAHKYVLAEKHFEQSLNFSSEETASGNRLASDLYTLNGVYNVFMAQDFVTINKLPDADWATLDAAVITVLNGYFA